MYVLVKTSERDGAVNLVCSTDINKLEELKASLQDEYITSFSIKTII